MDCAMNGISGTPAGLQTAREFRKLRFANQSSERVSVRLNIWKFALNKFINIATRHLNPYIILSNIIG
jgi:hypothetical protein